MSNKDKVIEAFIDISKKFVKEIMPDVVEVVREKINPKTKDTNKKEIKKLNK